MHAGWRRPQSEKAERSAQLSSQKIDKRDISGLSSSSQTAEDISGMDTLIAKHKVKQETKPAAKEVPMSRIMR